MTRRSNPHTPAGQTFSGRDVRRLGEVTRRVETDPRFDLDDPTDREEDGYRDGPENWVAIDSTATHANGYYKGTWYIHNPNNDSWNAQDDDVYINAVNGSALEIGTLYRAWTAGFYADSLLVMDVDDAGLAAAASLASAGNRTVINIKNNSGSAVGLYGILQIEDQTPVVLPTDDLSSFETNLVLNGVTPTASGKNFVVLLQALASGATGQAVVEGVVQVQVNVTNSFHHFATTLTSDASQLVSCAAVGGAVRIIWRASGSGAMWCVVQLPVAQRAMIIGRQIASSANSDGTWTFDPFDNINLPSGSGVLPASVKVIDLHSQLSSSTNSKDSILYWAGGDSTGGMFYLLAGLTVPSGGGSLMMGQIQDAGAIPTAWSGTTTTSSVSTLSVDATSGLYFSSSEIRGIAAGATQAGIVTTGTQSFAGNKTFTGAVEIDGTVTFGSDASTYGHILHDVGGAFTEYFEYHGTNYVSLSLNGSHGDPSFGINFFSDTGNTPFFIDNIQGATGTDSIGNHFYNGIATTVGGGGGGAGKMAAALGNV